MSVKDAVTERERRELEALLASPLFTRAQNIHRFLAYVGRKYFEKEADEIKEYTIAVEALNRRDTFDPRLDTIVRVTASVLRKRLDRYYAGEGASHAVRLEIRPGSYVPRFVPQAPRPGAPVVEPAPGPRPGTPAAGLPARLFMAAMSIVISRLAK